MAKSKPKVSRPVIYLGVAALVIGAVVMTTDSGPAKRPSGRPKGNARTTTSSKAAEKYTDEDYKAKFVSVTEPVADAFRPGIVPMGTTALTALLPNELPAGFANGEAKWRYTGTAIIDQSPQALIENADSGESVFLKAGESWKTCKVSRITPTTLTLLGPGGMVYTLQLMQDPVPADGEDVVANMRVEPLNPMAGNIGGSGRPGEGTVLNPAAKQPDSDAEVNRDSGISDTKNGAKANDAN